MFHVITSSLSYPDMFDTGIAFVLLCIYTLVIHYSTNKSILSSNYLLGWSNLNIKTMSLGPLGTNCYIIYDDHNALIVDPGGDADQVKAFIEQNKLIPQAILLTHAHFDHIGAVDELRSHFNIHVYLHEQEKSWLSNPELNRSVFFTGNE